MSGNRQREVAVGAGLGVAAGLLVERLDFATLVSWWGDTTYLVLAGAALGGALGALTVGRWLPGALLALLACWACVAFTPVTRWMAADLVDSRPAISADAVVPLASSLQRDGGLTSVALARVVTALELVAAGHTRRVIVTEVRSLPLEQTAPAVRRLMAGLGIEAEVIPIGPVGSTRDEAVAVAELMRQRGFERLLLVSSPVHTRRAALAFEAEGVEVTPVAARETRFDLERLDRAEDRLVAFGPILHERVGLVWYRWRGWIR